MRNKGDMLNEKVMGILLASTLILGACGHHQDSAKRALVTKRKKMTMKN